MLLTMRMALLRLLFLMLLLFVLLINYNNLCKYYQYLFTLLSLSLSLSHSLMLAPLTLSMCHSHLITNVMFIQRVNWCKLVECCQLFAFVVGFCYLLFKCDMSEILRPSVLCFVCFINISLQKLHST